MLRLRTVATLAILTPLFALPGCELFSVSPTDADLRKKDYGTPLAPGEVALEKVTDNAVAADMRRYALQTQRRYGLPTTASEFGIAPELEGEYLSQVKSALSKVYANEFGEAKKLVKQGR